MSIEKRVEKVILEEPTEIEIGGLTFEVPPVTFATLIMFSEVVSDVDLPDYDLGEDGDGTWKVAIREAGKAEVIADALAVLILGAKRIKEERYWHEYKRGKMTREKLRGHILLNSTPREALLTLMLLIKEMYLGDFFALTTSLAEINLLKPKKTEVVEKESKATAFGRTLSEQVSSLE